VPQEQIKATYIGGPTALFEWHGFRFLTDPTFDPAGGEYTTGPVVLKKLAGPVLAPETLRRVDMVLLSHDHHFDNLDQRAPRCHYNRRSGTAGREYGWPGSVAEYRHSRS
jgi:L-ascorbate metabolism protein UlaG (beta-lactamase superfamily)